jgi:hypothetical protein
MSTRHAGCTETTKSSMTDDSARLVRSPFILASAVVEAEADRGAGRESNPPATRHAALWF